MPSESSLADLTRTIQLAVAPVFLLTALGTLLSVLSTRIARIVDRARVLSGRTREVDEAARVAHNEEIELLSRRRWLMNYAFTSAVLAALQVCLLICVAFIGFILHKNFSLLIAGLFIGAMAAFILALLLLLREILLAVASTRLHPLPRA
jgi:ABC-type multidrug transport system fused ATPase/permease subunit